MNEPERKSFIQKTLTSRSVAIMSAAIVAIVVGFFLGRLTSSREKDTSSDKPSNVFSKFGFDTGHPWKIPNIDSMNLVRDSLFKAGDQAEVHDMKKSLNLTYEQADKILSIYSKRREELKTLISQQAKTITNFHDQTDSIIAPVLSPEQQTKWKQQLEDQNTTGLQKLLNRMKVPVGLNDTQEKQIYKIMAKCNPMSAMLREFNFGHLPDSEQREIDSQLAPDQRVKWRQQFNATSRETAK